MTTLTREAILELSISERIRLIEEIWDTIAETSEQIPLSKAQQDELGRRLEAYRANPDDLLTWEEVRGKMKDVDG